MPENPPARPLLTRRTVWVIAICSAALIALLVSVVPISGSDAKARAEQALGSIAAAQTASKDSNGTYASYWLTGGDHSLAAIQPITAGVAAEPVSPGP